MLKAVLALSLFAATAALAQAPIRIVVPFPPGGGADSLSRLMAPKLGELRKTQVIVENKPGATGHIGADAVAQAPADGHTLLMASTGAITERNLHQFAPVSLVSASPYVVTAAAKTPFSNVQELLKSARANPGKVTFGSSGTGAASHLSGELFKSMAKIDMLHVPYKGVGQAVTDLLAGQVDVLFAPAQAVIQHVRAGKLKALATTGARRTETLPEVATAGESGVSGYESVGWFGLLVRAETPKALVDALSADANRVLADAEVRKRMAALGADPAGNTPEEFGRFIRDDQAKWSKVMREAGIKPE
jgi:tripartite-type tricarboxylate transporter receptor subunit TctC